MNPCASRSPINEKFDAKPIFGQKWQSYGPPVKKEPNFSLTRLSPNSFDRILPIGNQADQFRFRLFSFHNKDHLSPGTILKNTLSVKQFDVVY